MRTPAPPSKHRTLAAVGVTLVAVSCAPAAQVLAPTFPLQGSTPLAATARAAAGPLLATATAAAADPAAAAPAAAATASAADPAVLAQAPGAIGPGSVAVGSQYQFALLTGETIAGTVVGATANKLLISLPGGSLKEYPWALVTGVSLLAPVAAPAPQAAPAAAGAAVLLQASSPAAAATTVDELSWQAARAATRLPYTNVDQLRSALLQAQKNVNAGAGLAIAGVVLGTVGAVLLGTYSCYSTGGYYDYYYYSYYGSYSCEDGKLYAGGALLGVGGVMTLVGLPVMAAGAGQRQRVQQFMATVGVEF